MLDRIVSAAIGELVKEGASGGVALKDLIVQLEDLRQYGSCCQRAKPRSKPCCNSATFWTGATSSDCPAGASAEGGLRCKNPITSQPPSYQAVRPRPGGRARFAASTSTPSPWHRSACASSGPRSWTGSSNPLRREACCSRSRFGGAAPVTNWWPAFTELEAARKCGHQTIRAEVYDDLGDDEAKLLQIDENLCRAELSPAERAAHLVERKRLYETLHPETGHGGDRRSAEARSSSHSENLKAFVEDTAAKTGKGRSTIAREAKRGADIRDVAQLAGTSQFGRRA